MRIWKTLLPTVTIVLATITAPTAQSASVSDVLTTETISAFSAAARADLVNALVTHRSLLEDGDINSAERLIHFMAQIATETGGFRRIDENMNYSAERLRAVFPRRVTVAKARELAGKPVAIANWVYGDRLGNRGRTTQDGWNYRGSGFIQLTGRDNFVRRGTDVGLPLGDDPELVRKPKEGLQAAVAYWKKCNSIADTGSITDVRKCVNGGTNGLKEAKMWHGRATRVFGAALSAAGLESPGLVDAGIAEELEGAKEILADLGYYEPSGLEGPEDEEKFASGVDQFLRDNNLPTPADAGTPGLEAAQENGLPEELLYQLSDAAHLEAITEAEAATPD
jgi:putative chitinase